MGRMELILLPKLKNTSIELMAIIRTKDNELIGVAPVTSGKEFADIERRKPKIFRDFWYIPTRRSSKIPEKVIPPFGKRFQDWFEERMKINKPPQKNDLIEFHKKMV